MIQTKHRPDFKRAEYWKIPKNPICIASFATDTRNIGGMVRTAESFLVESMFVEEAPNTGTSSGAEKWQNWYKPQDMGVGKYIEHYILWAYFDYRPVVLEQTDESLPLTRVKLPSKMLLITGNESIGVPAESLELLKRRNALFVEIPQFGFSGSLNVTTATSIILYEWIKQHAPIRDTVREQDRIYGK